MNGSELTTEMIFQAYQEGWFPMTVDEESNEVHWYQPKERCLFPLKGIHVSKSLAKTLKQKRFDVRFDTSFTEVMRSCMRPGENWITEDFIRIYSEAFEQGWGHCSECWHDGKLVGGVYGIALGGAFFAESMFHRETDASKVALYSLVETCRESGFVLFDAQILNTHLASLGAYTIKNRHYMKLLREALQVQVTWQT